MAPSPPPPPPPPPSTSTSSASKSLSARRKSEAMMQRDKVERESLFAAINHSTTVRKPIQFLSPQEVNEAEAEVDDRDRENGVDAEPDEVAPVPSDDTVVATRSSVGNGAILQKPTVDFDGLSWPSIGTKTRLEATAEERKARVQKISGAVATILENIGEDPGREGLLKTPARYAEALMFLTHGYELNLRDIVNDAVFEEDHDELVIVKDIDVFSLCEHHLVPFTGKMHVGYIPNGRVIGLSKIARIAEMFARRLQVQERLTKQVALAMAEVLEPLGVAVVMESSHLCIAMRGVRQTDSTTITSCMLGCMRSSAKTREEFLNLMNRK